MIDKFITVILQPISSNTNTLGRPSGLHVSKSDGQPVWTFSAHSGFVFPFQGRLQTVKIALDEKPLNFIRVGDHDHPDVMFIGY